MSNLFYRTRLRMAAAMLDFRDYGLFADCFGPRWNYCLRDIIASFRFHCDLAKAILRRAWQQRC